MNKEYILCKKFVRHIEIASWDETREKIYTKEYIWIMVIDCFFINKEIAQDRLEKLQSNQPNAIFEIFEESSK